MGSSGFEPPTSCLSGMRSNHLSYEPICDSPGLFSPSFPVSIHSRGCGGDDGIRTHDPLLAGQVLSQLSYTPMFPGSHRLFSLFQRSFLIPENRTTDNPFLSSLPLGFVPIFKLLSKLLSFASVLHRKEVIQPHLPIRLPCYDLTPIIEPTFDCCLPKVSSQASGVPNFHGLTGGVYKARERIHRSMLICDY